MPRPDDPRAAAVYDTLEVNRDALADDWWNPRQDVFENVTAMVMGALDLYDQDSVAFAVWFADAREQVARDADETDEDE